jgi:hypothetical protein
MIGPLASGARPVGAPQHASPPPADWRRFVEGMPPNQALNLRGLHRIVRAVVRGGARAFAFASTSPKAPLWSNGLQSTVRTLLR